MSEYPWQISDEEADAWRTANLARLMDPANRAAVKARLREHMIANGIDPDAEDDSLADLLAERRSLS